MCPMNINPPELPRCTVVSSDVQDKVFVVVEIDESRDTPHSIENSTKVYVRTGDASNPYKLADVDTINGLLRRRDQTHHQQPFLMQRATDRADRVVSILDEFFQVS